MTDKHERIKHIIKQKTQFDCYRYYCDLCLLEGYIRNNVRRFYQGKDLCERHYRELRKYSSENINNESEVFN